MNLFKDKSEQTEGGREYGKPHPEWERNVQYLKTIIEMKAIKQHIADMECDTDLEGKFRMEWNGVNKVNGIFEVLTSVTFSWISKGKNYGYPFNFHKRHGEFTEDVDRFFGRFMEKKRSMKELMWD